MPLGLEHYQAGRLDEAVDAYRQGIVLDPDCAEVHYHLGHALRDLGHLDEAVNAYRQAIAIEPNLPQAHYHAGLVLRTEGELDAAVAEFRQAIELQPDDAESHCEVGQALSLQGRWEDAIASFHRAIELCPTLLAAKAGLCTAMNGLVPQWHVPMMNDGLRNEFYFAALKNAVTPDSRVLEIGTGSGLLSMMAASLGARDVTTCEAVPLIAATARGIIAENGLDERIRVVSRRSSDITVGSDLAEPADILVSEIFSNEFLAEGVLPSIEDAKARLLKPGARIIPAGGSIMIALFGGDDIASNLVVGDACGFNLRHFNSIVARKQTVTSHDLRIEMLTNDVQAFRFDFEKDATFPSEQKILRIPVTVPGRCLGIIQWIRFEMGEDLFFENHPLRKSAVSGWHYCISILPSLVDLKVNQIAIVSAAHDRNVPWFSLLEVEEPSVP